MSELITYTSSNRTFMELKLGSYDDEVNWRRVLIAPLWN